MFHKRNSNMKVSQSDHNERLAHTILSQQERRWKEIWIGSVS